MKINKNIIMVVILIIAIILGIVVTKSVITNIKIKKLSQIDSEELESKIISKLEETPLNLQTSQYTTSFVILDEIEDEAFKRAMELYYSLEEKPNPLEGFVSAYIKEDANSNGKVLVPCFKINCDDKGKFKSIEFVEYTLDDIQIKGIIEDVFKNEYNVDITKLYDKRRDVTYGKTEVYCLNNEFLVKVANEIRENPYNTSVDEIAEMLKDKEYTTLFGVEKIK